jgi:hypothetical protein
MKNRFATFLLMGKVAALPLFSQESLSSINRITEKTSPVIDKHRLSDTEFITVQNAATREGRKVIFIPNNISKTNVPKILDLVITGLHDKDEVLVVVSPEKETSVLVDSKMGLPNNSKEVLTLSHFTVVDTPLLDKDSLALALHKNLVYSAGSEKTVSLPINLCSIPELTRDGSQLYLHVIVAPKAQWDKSLVRFSDVFELQSVNKTILMSSYGDVTEDCTAYTCY